MPAVDASTARLRIRSQYKYIQPYIHMHTHIYRHIHIMYVSIGIYEGPYNISHCFQFIYCSMFKFMKEPEAQNAMLKRL